MPCAGSSWDDFDDVEITIVPTVGAMWSFSIGPGACTLPGDLAEKTHVLDHLRELPGLTDEDVRTARETLASTSSSHAVIWRRHQ